MLLGWYGYLSLISLLLWDTFQSFQLYDEKLDEPDLHRALSLSLPQRCIETDIDEFRTNFAVCFLKGVVLNQFSATDSLLPIESNFWRFEESIHGDSIAEQVYTKTHHCIDETGQSLNESKVVVSMECCRHFNPQRPVHHDFIYPTRRALNTSTLATKASDLLVREVTNHGCETSITICSTHICKGTSSAPTASVTEQPPTPTIINKDQWQFGNISPREQREQLERVYDVFHHAYQSYMKNAFPKGELRPISCEGGNFDLIKIPLVTLIDTLDTLVVVNDYEEFRRATALLVEHLPRGFDFDVNISLFETTIRLLGGLLSAHLMAIDSSLGIYAIYHPKVPDLLNPSELKSFADEGVLFSSDYRLSKDSVEYHDELLILAIDLGHRLMPAFNTKTGIPYGTVNLRHGVPKGETKVSSTAGAGSLFIEFHVLSILTDDDRYGYAAFKALKSLYDRRSGLHLVGKHINIDSGQWQETMSGVGSNSDSFFEYHLKAYAMLHGARPLYQYYDQLYQAVKKYILPDDAWFREVEMFTGRFSRHRIENLDAFWPGLEVAMGHAASSARQLQALYSVWLDLGFLPEELDLAQWKSGKGPSNALYPLRPELIEATVYHYQATKDRSWLAAGQLILESIQNFTRTGCGYASLSNIMSMELTDEMPSFFLSETVKYLYLLFDEDHFLHRRSVIYSTEAHPFDLVQLRAIERERAQGSSSSRGRSVYRGDVLPHEEHFVVQSRDEDDRSAIGGGNGGIGGGGAFEAIRKGSERPRALKGRRVAAASSKTSNSSRRKARRTAKKAEQQEEEHENGESSEFSTSSSAHVCTVPKWWEVPRSFRWTTEDITTESVFALAPTTVSNHKGTPFKSRPQATTSRSDLLLPTSGTGVQAATAQRAQQRRIQRHQKNMHVMQRLSVHYYDAYGIPPHERPSSIVHLMQYLAGGEDLSSDDAKSSSSSDGGSGGGSGSDTRHPAKCPLNGEQAEQATVSLQSLEEQLLQLRDTTKKTTAEWLKHLPAPASVDEEKPLKTVELALGNVGSFDVQVFADAFRITHRQGQVTLDVANVGRRTLFVRQFTVPSTATTTTATAGTTTATATPTSVLHDIQAFATNPKGTHTSCHVELIQRDPTDAVQSDPDVLLRLPCALSSFSRNRPHVVEAELSLPSTEYDHFLCRKAVRVRDPAGGTTTARSRGIGRIAPTATRTALDDIAALRDWFRDRFLPAKTDDSAQDAAKTHSSTPHDHHTQEPSASSSSSELMGAVVLAERGQCLFEDKAVLAEKAGALALIVQNNENTLFMMAGKKEAEFPSPLSSGDAMDISMDMPVVMLSSVQSKQLMSAYRQQATDASADERGSLVKVRIVIEEKSSLLLSPLFGDRSFPKVWMSKQTIFAQASDRWGTFFQAKDIPATPAGKKGEPPAEPPRQDWQMFLVDLKDTRAQKLLPVLTLKTPHGHKMSTDATTLMMSMGQMYRHHIRRSCPADLIMVNPRNQKDVRVHPRRAPTGAM